MSVCCECCVLSGRGLCDGLITHPEGSYRLWYVIVCGLETSRMGALPAFGRSVIGKKISTAVFKVLLESLQFIFPCGLIEPSYVLSSGSLCADPWTNHRSTVDDDE